MPLAYLVGKEEFFGLEFDVNHSVLIPRPETEVITEKAMDLIKRNHLTYILDLCCGSANIAVTIKKMIKKNINVKAADLSSEAISIARKNIKKHGVDVKVIKSNLFEKFQGRQFDLIVSNPPYVAGKDIQGSIKYEPRLALYAGSEGLLVIKKILSQAYVYLRPGGFMVLESGHNQKMLINRFLEKIGKYEIIEWINDYGGNFRGIVLQSAKR